MTKSPYIHTSSAQFERLTQLGVPVLRVFDEEWNQIFDLPGTLSDEEARQVIRVINGVYSKGYEYGELSRSREILRLLGGVEASND
ncbi:hypothetical protein RJE46_10660 [Cedecea neteri]|uniref:hypothetical protein n=1 Tax=Cedecea neteri TaxID=158822 RepID=UPI002892FEA8|nr:hypothetical protein [Cedecea neteri]WNJ81658.1 hypothetical protein RJE46_10660 [Cedecea neteri]